MTRASKATPLKLPEALRLERNLAILAGAGTGKTYSLITLCLHLLGGAREGHEPLEPARLGLVTFTDKAAGEMRERLRQRLDALANGDGADAEAELRASFEGKLPPPSFWRRVRDDLGAASISTFHALCIQLLRRAPPASDIDPNFELLNERDAAALLVHVTERVVLEAVQKDVTEIRELVRDQGFGGAGNWGLVDALVPVVARLREEGLTTSQLPSADEEALRESFDESVSVLRQVLAEGVPNTPKLQEAFDTCRELLDGLTLETWPQRVDGLQKAIYKKQNATLATLRSCIAPKPSRPPEDKRLRHLGQLYGALRMAPYESQVRALLDEVMHRHARELKRRRVIDFTGLLVQTRDLLRDYPEARREAQAAFGALLVDEFQDTNRLQLEVVLMLAERREGAPRTLDEGACLEEALPLEPAFLAIVGDRKQAIYEFRGADVSVFEVAAAAIERSGGGRAFLKTSRRSSPQLVKALNALMPGVLGPGRYEGTPEDFEVVYQPEADDLVAHRKKSPDDTPLCRVQPPEPLEGKVDAATFRELDADAVARAVAELLNRGEYEVEPRDGERRPLRGGDVALLFQRFTQVETYRAALVRHRVRHRVLRGRGFFGAQEVIDVACFLSVLADLTDTLSLAAVLRGPLVGLSDESLLRLAMGGEPGRGLRAEQVLGLEAAPTWMGDDESKRLMHFITSCKHLRRDAHRLGVRASLAVACDEFSWPVLAAAGPYGEQAVANLEKLLALAGERDADGVSIGAFARELLSLAEDEPREAQAELIDDGDTGAVTLCTVHQAKGLEWPVVVLPDLQGGLASRDKALRFDRTLGLALKPSGEAFEGFQSLNARHIDDRNKRRAGAESLRLLYVALTRARERVVLGLSHGARANTWARLIDEAVEAAGVEVAPLEAPEAPTPPPPDERLPEAVARRHVQAALDRVRVSSPPAASTAVLAVTQLQDFVTCPRLFHFAHQLSLTPADVTRPDDDARPMEDEPGGDSIDVRARGTAAHRLLEVTPLEAVGTPALGPTLKALRRDEGLEAAGDEVVRWVEAFWRTPFGLRLGALGDERVHRELPFLLTLTDDAGFRLALKGQIDLLVEEDEEALVVDYKTSVPPASGLEHYRFQLGCYVLAARRFLGKPVGVRAGIVFLRHSDVTPAFLKSPEDERRLEAELVAQARALTQCQAAFSWPGRQRSACEAARCGFISRCHPE